MIRRPATIVALGEEEVKCHLRNIFWRSLPLEFDALHLHGQDQSFSDDSLDDSFSDDIYTSINSEGEFDLDSLSNSTPVPFCGRNSIGPGDLIESSETVSDISTILPAERLSQRGEQASLKTHMTEPLPMIKNINFSPRDQERKGTYKQGTHQTKTGKRTDNQRFTSPSSPDAFQELTITNVRPRALFSEPTESDKPEMVDTKPLPINSDDVDWEFGTVQSAEVFEIS